MIFEIAQYDKEGKQVNAIKLTEEEYLELERAMQWPEDLAKWDRLNTPIEAGLGANGLVFLNL